MTHDLTAFKTQLNALSDWWEGAGVSIDRRNLDRMLAAIQKEAQATQPEPGAPATAAQVPVSSDALIQAHGLAGSADTLEMLKDALTRFDGCALKAGAQQTVFADGNPDADVMVIGEGPGREEDRTGLPFVGRAGQLLDRMLASIGVSRAENAYITNVNFWRPPGNRNPTDEELALCRPFVDRHISLVKPKLIITAGAVPSQSLLGLSDGILKLRGKSYQLSVPGLDAPIPVYPILHPAYLLRRPAEKSRAWEDLLNILKALEELGAAPSQHP